VGFGEMSLVKQFIFVTFIAFFSQNSWAYHLSDHSTLTMDAINEFNHCFPGIINSSDADILRSSNLNEDLNLFRKEFIYSHYYNPTKKLQMWRKDSMERVTDLQNNLSQPTNDGMTLRSDILVRIGHIIHHIQDMTVPAHVIPITHANNDGFEIFSVQGPISSDLSCTDIETLSEGDSEKILLETASMTMIELNAFTAIAIKKGTVENDSVVLGGVDFWIAAENQSFGSYGVLGNSYGDNEIATEKGVLVVPNGTYIHFKHAQMKLAVQNTLRVIYWSLIKKNPAIFLPPQRLADTLTTPFVSIAPAK
jgi:hypothetical protein